jgi:transposase-like protein
MRSGTHWQWHLDEVFVKINGEQHYLWRAVDHEGEVLESFVTKRQDRKAALKFFKKTIKRNGNPQIFVTIKLRSYGAAMKVIGSADKQNWPLAQQSGQKFTSAIPTKKTGIDPLQAHANLAEIRCCPRFHSQPFQSRPKPFPTRLLQGQPHHLTE